MIIKPKVCGNGGKLAAYLLADKKNDRAELLEMRGFFRQIRRDYSLSPAP